MNTIPKTILELRKALGLTHAQMAELIGVSRPTYSDIEKGKSEITMSGLRSLSEKSGLSLSSIVAREDSIAESLNQKALVKYKKMLLFMLHRGADQDGKITKTKLAKLLYLADFGWFYQNLNSMSGLPYRRIKYGPVPDQFFRALEELIEEHQIRITGGGAQMVSPVEKSPPQLGLTKEEKNLMTKIGRKWKRANTKDIVEFTHNQLPWKLCKDNELIPYELIIQEDPEHVY